MKYIEYSKTLPIVDKIISKILPGTVASHQQYVDRINLKHQIAGVMLDDQKEKNHYKGRPSYDDLMDDIIEIGRDATADKYGVHVSSIKNWLQRNEPYIKSKI